MSEPIPGILDVQKAKAQTVLDCLANGMSERDALTLAEWTAEDFQIFKDNNLKYASLVEKKKVEYKQALIKPIMKSVRAGDEKLAQWLLERQFQDEFSNKRKPQEQSSNPITLIINQIQQGTGLQAPKKVRQLVVHEQAHHSDLKSLPQHVPSLTERELAEE